MYNESVKIKNKNNLNLAAVIHRPANKDKSPCVLVLHGFLGNKEEEHIRAFCEELAKVGFVAIRFDSSGFGESEGNVEKDFRVSNYLSDVGNVFDYAKSLPFIDKDYIGICGHSLGGSLALIFSALHSGIKACCAIQAATKLTRSDSPINLRNWQNTGWFEVFCDEPVERTVKLPYAMAEDADRFDALQYVSMIKMPTMIMYGTEDIDVKPKNTLLLYEAAKNCPKELIELKGFDHYFKRDPEKLELVVNHLKSFFEKHLAMVKSSSVG